MRTIGHWVNGLEQVGRSSRSSPVYNPATGKLQAEVALASGEEVDGAIVTALGALDKWSDSSLAARSKVLFAFRQLATERASTLAEMISDEHGKVLSDAMGEVQRGLEVVEFACGIPTLLKGEYSDQVSTGVDVFSYRKPLGVVAGITPFNFPVMVPMWMYPVAIACGNTFVLKPSEKDPSPSLFIAQLWAEAGLPNGVFNVINGDEEAVNALLEHPSVAAVSFVGSTPVARFVYRKATNAGKRVQALGGAKNHAVILPDADVSFAGQHLAAAAFGSAGERCMAISAAVAVADIGEALVKATVSKAAGLKVGPGRDAGSDMGPLITRDAQERVTGYISRSEREGARLALDGRSLVVKGHEDGFFVGPTILDQVRPEMEVYRDEIFGPVLSVLHVGTVDEAIALVNKSRYGNGTALFTSSGESARRFHRQVDVGMVGINVPIPVPMAYYSFGGWKDSLFGERRIHGTEGVEFYTRQKVVTSRWPVNSNYPAATASFPTSD